MSSDPASTQTARSTAIEIYDSVDSVASAWDELAERTAAPPWLRPAWISAWWRAFANGALQIRLLRRDGAPAAILPLVQRRGGLFSPTNWHTPDFRLVGIDREANQALLKSLFSNGVRRVSLGFLDDEDVAACRHIADAMHYRVLLRTLESPPFVSTRGDRAAYEQSLDRHKMSEMRRRKRRLQEQGTLSFAVEDGGDRLEQLLAEGFRVEASGWKGQAGTAILSSEQTRRFYSEIARYAAERGWLRLAFLRLDRHAIAFQFLIEYGGVLSQLKGGFDDAYKKYAPGTLLLQEVIGGAFEGNAESYEFLGADEPFKLEWATGTRDRKLLQAFQRSLPGRLEHAVFAYGRPLAKRVLAIRRP